MVNDTDSRRLSLSNVQNCKVDSANSWSLGCYGPAAQFRNKPPFTVEHGSDVTDFPFFLSVRLKKYTYVEIGLGILKKALKYELSSEPNA